VRPSLEFIPLVFSVFKVGAIPVLIDPGMGRKAFLSCLERMAPRVLIAVPLVHAVRGLFRAAFRSVEVGVTAGGTTGWWGGVTLEGLRIASDEPFESLHTARDDQAAILFTSGSTGPAKGVVYTHGIFDAQARFIQEMYGIEAGEVDLACFPLFGLFSMALGMTVVIPELDPTKPAKADPAKLVHAIQSQACTSAFGSPAIWKNVARHCQRVGTRLPTLRRILMAGAPVPARLHEAFSGILSEGAEVHTPFGATESLPVASIGSREVLRETAARTREGAGTCVGRPAPDMSIRIIAIDDAPIERWSQVRELPAGEIGEICVRGPVVTPRYEAEPEHTRAAKIVEVDADGSEHVVHRMGDVGYLDPQGRLWFCGRKRHRVETSTGTLYPVPCEAIFDEHPDVFKTALVGVEGEPRIIVQLEPDAKKAPSKVAVELLELGSAHPHTRDIRKVHFHPSFPVDVRHNAKIHREQLADWAARR
ncbi:MAG: fatty acid CoA ligase family protein, partial [Myxococcota bacterium]